MSIIITNKGQAPGENETTRIYHVCDNNGLITEFTHDREDGLAECLRKAAGAVGKAISKVKYVNPPNATIPDQYFKLHNSCNTKGDA